MHTSLTHLFSFYRRSYEMQSKYVTKYRKVQGKCNTWIHGHIYKIPCMPHTMTQYPWLTSRTASRNRRKHLAAHFHGDWVQLGKVCHTCWFQQFVLFCNFMPSRNCVWSFYLKWEHADLSTDKFKHLHPPLLQFIKARNKTDINLYVIYTRFQR